MNVECWRLFSYHHYLLSSESLRVLGCWASVPHYTFCTIISNRNLEFHLKILSALGDSGLALNSPPHTVREWIPLPVSPTCRETQKTPPSIFCSVFSLRRTSVPTQKSGFAVLPPSELRFFSNRSTSQNQIDCEWWGLCLRYCSVSSNLSPAPHLSQFHNVSPPSNTLSNKANKHPHTLREKWLIPQMTPAVFLPWVSKH